MNIRRAEDRDLEAVLILLSQVLEIHAEIRPDLFVSGTTKYGPEDLASLLKREDRLVLVCADESDEVLGYAFCFLPEKESSSSHLRERKTLYLDDLCVDESRRGEHIGLRLLEEVKREARRLGAFAVTLNVWEGNDSAKRFYEKAGFLPVKTMMELPLVAREEER